MTVRQAHSLPDRNDDRGPRPDTMITMLGLSKLFAGLTLVALPGTMAQTWFGAGRNSPPLRITLRSLGARDLAIAAGLLTSTDRLPWLWASVLADSADASASVIALRVLPPTRLIPAVLLALSAATSGAIAAQHMVATRPGR